MNAENQIKQREQRDQREQGEKKEHLISGDRQGANRLSGKTVDELEKEWDIEKVVELSAAVVTIASVLLSHTKNKQLNKLGHTMSSLLGVDNLKNWRPPTPFLRGMGFRSREEIDREIKSLLGK